MINKGQLDGPKGHVTGGPLLCEGLPDRLVEFPDSPGFAVETRVHPLT